MKKKIIIGVFLAIFVLIMMPVNSAVESNIVEDINKKDLITLIKDTRSNLKDLISSEKLEQRIKDIKDILVDIVVNSNLQDNNPEPKFIIILSLLYILGSLAVFIGGIIAFAIDILMLIILLILVGP